MKPTLTSLLARRRQRRLPGLFGKLEFDPSYDYKAERSRKSDVSPTPARGRSPARNQNGPQSPTDDA